MIAALVLLNPPSAAAARTPLRKLLQLLLALGLLLNLRDRAIRERDSRVVGRARLARVRGHGHGGGSVVGAEDVGAGNAGEEGEFGRGAGVDLAGAAGRRGTPEEVWDGGEEGACCEGVVSEMSD